MVGDESYGSRTRGHATGGDENTTERMGNRHLNIRRPQPQGQEQLRRISHHIRHHVHLAPDSRITIAQTTWRRNVRCHALPCSDRRRSSGPRDGYPDEACFPHRSRGNRKSDASSSRRFLLNPLFVQGIVVVTIVTLCLITYLSGPDVKPPPTTDTSDGFIVWAVSHAATKELFDLCVLFRTGQIGGIVYLPVSD